MKDAIQMRHGPLLLKNVNLCLISYRCTSVSTGFSTNPISTKFIKYGARLFECGKNFFRKTSLSKLKPSKDAINIVRDYQLEASSHGIKQVQELFENTVIDVRVGNSTTKEARRPPTAPKIEDKIRFFFLDSTNFTTVWRLHTVGSLNVESGLRSSAATGQCRMSS